MPRLGVQRHPGGASRSFGGGHLGRGDRAVIIADLDALTQIMPRHAMPPAADSWNGSGRELLGGYSWAARPFYEWRRRGRGGGRRGGGGLGGRGSRGGRLQGARDRGQEQGREDEGTRKLMSGVGLDDEDHRTTRAGSGSAGIAGRVWVVGRVAGVGRGGAERWLRGAERVVMRGVWFGMGYLKAGPARAGRGRFLAGRPRCRSAGSVPAQEQDDKHDDHDDHDCSEADKHGVLLLVSGG